MEYSGNHLGKRESCMGAAIRHGGPPYIIKTKEGGGEIKAIEPRGREKSNCERREEATVSFVQVSGRKSHVASWYGK